MNGATADREQTAGDASPDGPALSAAEPLDDDPQGRRWRPASAEPGAALARLVGAAVADDATIEPWLGPTNSVGARYFRCYLATEAGRTREPVVFGLQHSGPYPGNNWIEIAEYRSELTLPDARVIEVPDSIELRIFAHLAELVPIGGHLMAEYESPARSLTAHALALSVPPVATPLGATLRAVGCGAAIRDWYIPEGGREGPRKLQGFRAVDAAHERRRAAEMVVQLERFLADERDLDWDVLGFTRPIARTALVELQALAEGEPPAQP
jgi:hypothetical protein